MDVVYPIDNKFEEYNDENISHTQCGPVYGQITDDLNWGENENDEIEYIESMILDQTLEEIKSTSTNNRFNLKFHRF